MDAECGDVKAADGRSESASAPGNRDISPPPETSKAPTTESPAATDMISATEAATATEQSVTAEQAATATEAVEAVEAPVPTAHTADAGVAATEAARLLVHAVRPVAVAAGLLLTVEAG